MTFFCKLIIVTIYMLYSFCLTCLLILTLSTTISCLKDLTLGSQFCGTALDWFRSYLKPHTICLNRWKKIYSNLKLCSVTFLPPLRFGNDTIHASDSARNIRVIFDGTVSMLPHVNSVCKSALYHLRHISRIRKFVSSKTTEILVHAFCIMC